MHITSFFTLLEIWSLSCSYRYSVLLIRKSLFCDTMLIQAASSGLLCSNPFYHNLYLNLNIKLPKTAKVQKHKDPIRMQTSLANLKLKFREICPLNF